MMDSVGFITRGAPHLFRCLVEVEAPPRASSSSRPGCLGGLSAGQADRGKAYLVLE